jgi:hypothetical protein|nr:MAG TPA: hypothetical protein [Caudoviricetes sp.]
MTNIVYNTDCMVGLREYPDKYFDLAVNEIREAVK